MTKNEYNLIAMCIFRSGFIKDKNQIKKIAGEKMRHLIVSDLIGTFKHNKNFNEKKFYKTCSLS